MRRICTSDWQLDANPRDRYRIDFVVKTLPALIQKYQPDQLIICGDITESKDSHPAPLVNEIVNAFYNLSQLCEVIVLQGNHDFLHKGHPYFEFLANFENVSWISVPTVRGNCLYLPHTRDYKKDWAHVDLKANYDFIFAHNIFTGVSTNTGHALSGIPPSIFPKGSFVISGDVHEPQIINENICYVGSPTITDFGDEYEPRVLLLDHLKVKSIKVQGQQKRLIDCIWDQRVYNFPVQTHTGDIVKIRVHLEMQHVSEWATIREQVQQWATKNKFVIDSIVPIVAYEQGKRQKVVGTNSKKSDIQYVDALVNRQGVDERTANIGRGILDTI